METKHRKGAFLLAKEYSGISPTERLLQGGNPIIYSGTEWKVKRNAAHLQKFALNSRTKSWGATLGFDIPQEQNPRQLAVPAVEPNHLIDQHALMIGKAENQVESLRVALDEHLTGEDIIIPSDLYYTNDEGGVIEVLSSDVGVREREGSGLWEARRNYYLTKHELHSTKINVDQLRQKLLGYYAKIYGAIAVGGELVRAIDSALALTDIKFERRSGDGRIVGSAKYPLDHLVHPANSTVGVVFERNPLGDRRQRNAFVDYLIAKEQVKHKLKRENGLSDPNQIAVSALRGMNNIAGGAKVEDLHHYAQAVGISTKILADNGENGKDKEEALIDHVKGAPYILLQALLLTLSKRSEAFGRRASDGFLLELYPEGSKDQLRIF